VPVQREARHAAQRDAAGDAERAEPDACGEERVGVAVGRQVARLAGRGDHAQRRDRGRQVAEAHAGAVRPGRGRARERLGVDVALVLQREPVRRQLVPEPPQRDPGLDRDQPRPGSASSTRCIRPTSISTPSVQAMSVNE
jgi:hypothetical protein